MWLAPKKSQPNTGRIQGLATLSWPHFLAVRCRQLPQCPESRCFLRNLGLPPWQDLVQAALKHALKWPLRPILSARLLQTSCLADACLCDTRPRETARCPSGCIFGNLRVSPWQDLEEAAPKHAPKLPLRPHPSAQLVQTYCLPGACLCDTRPWRPCETVSGARTRSDRPPPLPRRASRKATRTWRPTVATAARHSARP